MEEEIFCDWDFTIGGFHDMKERFHECSCLIEREKMPLYKKIEERKNLMFRKKQYWNSFYKDKMN